MKRVVLLLLLAGVVSSQVVAKTGWDARGFKGKVKRCEESDKSSKMIFEFDSSGNEINFESYSFDTDKKKFVQSTKLIRNFTYDARHNVIMKVEVNGSTRDTIRYEYDSLNRVTSETNYSTSRTTSNKYDNKGNLVESAMWDLQGNYAGETSTYSFNTKGLLVELDYHSTGSSGWKNLYKYNEKGQNTGFQRVEIPTVEESDDNEDYDEEESSPTEAVTAEGRYTYDDHGNQIDDEMKNRSPLIFSHSFKNTYTYDSTGNWTKKDVVSSGNVQAPIIRKIEYYPAK